jgi:hypothetical protein
MGKDSGLPFSCIRRIANKFFFPQAFLRSSNGQEPGLSVQLHGPPGRRAAAVHAEVRCSLVALSPFCFASAVWTFRLSRALFLGQAKSPPCTLCNKFPEIESEFPEIESEFEAEDWG